jgi:hypothetical protein
MGRPLKIQKYSAMSGIFTTGPTAQAVALDQAYPPFSQLVAPTLPDGTNPAWLGVVGGLSSTATTTAYPIVKCQIYIANSYSAECPGQIVRQKGSRKFLVATTAAIDPANAVVGVSLRIYALGNTNWQSIGAPVGAAVGTIFTTTAAAGAGTTGTAQEVGQCVLTSDLSPTAGNMSISYFLGDSSEVAISKITNRFIQNFAGGETGGNASTGDVWNPTQVVNNVVLDANFFTDEGTEAKSGADVATWATGSQNAAGTLNMAIVENYTS